MERGHVENNGKTLALRKSGQCVALVVMKDLLQHISCHDRWVPPSRMTGRILTSTRSVDLIFSSLNFGQANFDIEAQSLFRTCTRKKDKELISWMYR